MTASAGPWRWNILPLIAATAFVEKPNIPLPIWAKENVFLDRRMTTRPGHPDPDEYPWTWEFAEIMRTRHVWEKEIEPGVVVIVDSGTEGAMFMRVHQLDGMKCTQSAFTENVLHEIRFCAKHDKQNVIFAIDNVKQAGEVNEIRLQPTLRKLGQNVMSTDDDDAGKFLIKMPGMLIYFLGSYSAGAFTQKMCELGINDELEEHGTKNSVDDLKSRMKTSDRRLLVNISKPNKLTRNQDGKITGGPIAVEHSNGSQHVYEVPCPHCTETNGGRPSGYQQFVRENMKFGHCKNLLGEWDLTRVLKETYFECIHCRKPIEETWKRWMNHRDRRRWRRTNFVGAEPNHISFQISDYYGYDDSVRWGRLAIEWIKSKGNPEKRATYINHHDGLPVEVKETKTEIADLLLLRGPYKRGSVPWMPRAIILGADVGLEYVKWGVGALRVSPDGGEGECALIDWGKDLHPDDIARRIITQRYRCLENDMELRISLGGEDAKYRKIEVHKSCLRVPRRLFPTAGIRAGLSMRSISFNRPPQRPSWFGVIVYNDDDAKSELYIDRIGSWARYLKSLKLPDGEQVEKPFAPRLWFPEDIQHNSLYGGKAGGDKKDDFLAEFTREHLIELTNGRFEWKRKGANEGGDIAKIICVIWRFFTLLQAGELDLEKPSAETQAAAEIQAAISTGE
ncbi:MAG TPA: terminase gpA endonuclease subunit [Chthoniobacterales bacterium]